MGLHCEHLPASTVVHDFEQRTISGANGVSDALGMGSSAGYTFISVIIVLCVLTVSISILYMRAVAFVRDIHMHIYVVTNLLMFCFWIKLTMKMPNYLTLGPPSARRRTKGRRLPCQRLPKPTPPIQTPAVRGSYQGETDRERRVGAHASHQAHAYHTWWV